jgi:hypothetical protein
MRWVGLMLAVAGVSGCTQLRDLDIYRELTPGLALSQVRQVLAVPRAKIWVDEARGEMRAMMASARSVAEIIILLEKDRTRLVKATYHFLPHEYLPHETQRGAPAAYCERDLAPIRTELEELYGPPEVTTSTDADKINTVLAWHPPHTIIYARQYIDGDRCGILETMQFDGSEADYQDFVKRVERGPAPG